MLFIFRKLRRSFFLPGKVRTYVAYAFGEVVLIVVGILIAVQIGEWNQDRADTRLEYSYIEQLILNFESDTGRAETQTETNNLRIHFVDILMQAEEDPNSVRGHAVEFLAAIAQVTSPSEEPLSSGSFDELQSTGHLKLLDPELKKKLFDYYRAESRMRQFEFERNGVALEFRKLRKGI